MNLDALTTDSIPDIGSVRLPVPLTSLLGRETELGDLTALIRRRNVRLVTLTGAGGVGKTRLAVELANRVRDSFPGGQFYVRLGELRDPYHVVATMIGLLRAHLVPHATTTGMLAEALGDTPILFVLNSAERVIDARADIAEMLEQFPGVTALVTSRTPLRVRGEHEYPLAPLPMPRPEMTLDQLRRVPAVELFLERARAVRPSFELDEQNAPDVVEILRHLDALPFAIELIALRTRLFPLRVIRERMDHLLDFLSGAPHDLPPRLRSMRASIQWSYDMLAPCEQKVFRALSVFASPFSFEAAWHVLHGTEEMPVGEVMDALAQLVDHSFLMPMTLRIGNAGYRMPEAIRAFGREKLIEAGERSEVLARELDFYRRGLEVQAHQLYGPQQAVFVARLDQHVGNLLDSLRAAREDGERIQDALRVATLLEPYWLLRGRVQEGVSFLQGLIEQVDETVVVGSTHRADAYRALGSLYVELYRLDEARSCHQRALQLYQDAGNEAGMIDSANNLGVVAMKMGDIEVARELLAGVLEARRDMGNLLELAETLVDMGDLAMHDGDLPYAREHYAEAYRLHVDMENPVGIVCDCVNLLAVAMLDDDQEPVEQWYRIGQENAEAIGDTLGHAQLRISWALLQLRRTRNVTQPVLREIAATLRVIFQSDSRRLILEMLPMAAEACVHLGDDRLAAQVLGAAESAAGLHHRFAWYRGRRYLEAMEKAMSERLGAGDYARFTTLGSYQTARQTIEAVIELIDRRVREVPAAEPATPPSPQERLQLTGREKQVLTLVAQGLSDKDIATTLGISPRTAMTHVSNIMSKMKVHSRSAASEHGIRLGVIDAPRDDPAPIQRMKGE